MHAASHQNKQPRREYQGRGPRHNLSNQRRVSSRSTLVLSASLFAPPKDRKSTRLNSSHSQISYAVFCLKKKNHNNTMSHEFVLMANLDLAAAFAFTFPVPPC